MTDEEIIARRDAEIEKARFDLDEAIEEALFIRDEIINAAWVTCCSSIDEAKAKYQSVTVVIKEKRND